MEEKHFYETDRLTGLLNILWAYLHLGPFEREMAILPVIPAHSLRIDLAIKIPTIQVGVVAAFVPPGASIFYCTPFLAIAIIVTILCGKWLAVVIAKRISCSAWKKGKAEKSILKKKLVFIIVRAFYEHEGTVLLRTTFHVIRSAR